MRCGWINFLFLITLLNNQGLKKIIYSPQLIALTWVTPLSTQGYAVNDKTFAGELAIKAEELRNQSDLLNERDAKELAYKKPYWEASIQERPAWQR